jgi:VanZ family protein
MRSFLNTVLAQQRAWRGLCLALVLTICWLAFSPAPPPQLHTHWDKLNHALAFATLAVCAGLGWPGGSEQGLGARSRRAGQQGLWLMAFGAFIELVQTQLPPRSGEAADLLADATGVLLGWGLLALLRHGVATARR